MWKTVATILLLACFTPLHGQTPQTDKHQHGSMPSGDGDFNPFVIADHRGGFYLAYIHRAGDANNVMLRRSADGEHYSEPVRVNDREGDAAVRNENPPKVAVGPHGEVYVCWANERVRWKGDIRFARSTDDGKTFAQAITLNSDADTAPTGHAFQAIAVDRRGRITVAWIDERNKQKEDRGAEIWISASTDSGKTFTRDRKILANVCECCRTNLQMDAAGSLFISYRTVPANGPMLRDIIVARSLDGGKTFAQAVVSSDQWEINGCPVAGPSFSVDPSGNLTVVWFMGEGERPGLYYASSTDKGKTFAARQPLDSRPQIGKHAQTVRLSDGRLFVAWDYGADKASSAWGVLDPRKGLLERSGDQSGITYPVAAVSGQITVVAGMRSATREIVTIVETLKAASKTVRPRRGSE